MTTAVHQVWSYGGGVQSVAMACLIDAGRLPVPDLAVIADTGREASTTWSYLDKYVQPMMAKHGVQILVAPHTLSKVDLYGAGEKLLIPAWTFASGKAGRLPTYCSTEWKKRVVHRWLRSRGVKQAEVWFGITVDEATRMKDSGLRWISNRYPLIDLFLKRRDCYEIIKTHGLPEPAKSSCWMCPHRGPKEWGQLEGDDMQKALDFDTSIRAKDPDVTIFSPKLNSMEEEGCDGGFCWT